MSTIQSLDIIIPTKNNNEDLKKCLFSLNQHLNFNNYKIEIIIVSDNSSLKNNQDLFELIKKFQQINKKLEIKLIILKEKSGMSIALNSGIEYCLSKKSIPTYIGFLHDDSIISQNWENNLIEILDADLYLAGVGSITYNEIDEQSVTIQKNKFNKNIRNDEISRIKSLNDLFYSSIDKIDKFIDLKINLFELEEIYNNIKEPYLKFQKLIQNGGLNSLSSDEKLEYEEVENNFNIAEQNLNNQNDLIKNLNNEFEEPFNNLNDLMNSSFKKIEPIIYNSDFEIDQEPERSESENKKDSSSKISLFGSIFKSDSFKEFGKFDEDLISSYRIEDEFCKRLIKNDRYVALIASSFVSHKCKSLTNNSVINKLLRNATLNNIELKTLLNSSKFKKPYVIYTCIFENENLPNFKNYDIDNFDYFCFVDDQSMAVPLNSMTPWKFIKISKFSKILGFDYNDDAMKIKMFFKYHPHFFFKNYNMSIWFDAKDILEMPINLTEIIELKNKNHGLLTLESTAFDCVYKELIYTFKNKIISENVYNEILNIYRKFRYPQNNGLIDTSFMVFKHNNEEIKLVLNKIWNFIKKYNSNDKLFVNLCFWLYKQSYSAIYNSLFFNYILKDLK